MCYWHCCHCYHSLCLNLKWRLVLLLHPSSKLVVCCVILQHLFFQLLLFHPSVLEPDLHLPGPIKTKSRHVFLFVGGELSWGVYYYAEALSIMWKDVADMGQLSSTLSIRIEWLFCHSCTPQVYAVYAEVILPDIAHKNQFRYNVAVDFAYHNNLTVLIRNALTEDYLSSKNFAGETFFLCLHMVLSCDLLSRRVMHTAWACAR